MIGEGTGLLQAMDEDLVLASPRKFGPHWRFNDADNRALFDVILDSPGCSCSGNTPFRADQGASQAWNPSLGNNSFELIRGAAPRFRLKSGSARFTMLQHDRFIGLRRR